MKAKSSLTLIVAQAENGAIGLGDALPWPTIPEDMQWFRSKTQNKVVIMGRKTWDGLPTVYKPLPNRYNVVVSNSYKTGSEQKCPHLVVKGTAEGMLDTVRSAYPDLDLMVIGGKEIYTQFFPFVTDVFLTRVNKTYPADTYLDVQELMDNLFVKTSVAGAKNPDVMFETWKRI